MSRVLLQLARSRAGGAVLRTWLRVLPAVLPLHILHRSPTLIAFRHPRPAYPVHLLFVPLPPRRGLEALTAADAPGLAELLRTAHVLARALDLEPGWRLVANGGAYQEVRVLHFHLIAENGGINEKGVHEKSPS